jgi:elongation factor G
LGAVQDPCLNKPFASGAADAGQIFAAVKSDHLAATGLLKAEACLAAPDWARPPTSMFECVLAAENERDETKLSGILARLGESDPGLVVGHEEGTGFPMIHTQGPLHLRETCKALAEIFKVTVVEREPNPVYRETITKATDVHYRHRKQSGGAGQFADVKLTVKPNARGAGFSFAETVKGGSVPRNYIPAVEAGAQEALARGPLGFPVIDVGVVLTDGQHHSVDSSDFAFRAAGRMGVHQALAEAAPVLLQPVYRVECHVPSIYSGNLVPLVSSLKGQVLGFDRDEHAKGWDLFKAQLPGSALEELARSLRSVTRGTGYFDREFAHFEELYGKEADAIVTMQKG